MYDEDLPDWSVLDALIVIGIIGCVSLFIWSMWN